MDFPLRSITSSSCPHLHPPMGEKDKEYTTGRMDLITGLQRKINERKGEASEEIPETQIPQKCLESHPPPEWRMQVSAGCRAGGGNRGEATRAW